MAKILVADDNSNIQKMVGLALKDQGIDVVAVGNGEAAVRKISDIRPDLVLADVFMPVRNGYEVCRYVKEDASLAHIPVILLVGAFDPLDEQEAQRSGADGVLKKPFVPPDPLISMVKSALIRAGIPLGPAAPADKTPPPPKRTTAEILGGGVGSKLAALAPEKLPEIMPEPVEEFPTAAPHLKIAAGSEPLAFGSLLETPDAEDMAVTAKPMINLAKWDEESDDVKEEPEEEEESGKGGWHPGGLDADLGNVAAAPHLEAAPDWRDEAFHGNSPAKTFSSSHWAPSIEQPAVATESESIAVATVDSKPADGTIPFSGDAWAAAMAAGVEEKIAPALNEAAAIPEVHEAPAEQISETAPAVEPVVSEQVAAEPANWAPAGETAWEMEAKKASLLASTWDAPKAPLSVDDTQEIPAYSDHAVVEHAEAAAETVVEHSAYSPEPIVASEHVEQAEAAVNEPDAAPSFESSAPKNWENAWEAPAVEPVTGQVHAEVAKVEEQAHVAEPETAAAAKSAETDMDELVARVLGKMNPDVLQKVTREILRPVIEAIVRDEMNSKKS